MITTQNFSTNLALSSLCSLSRLFQTFISLFQKIVEDIMQVEIEFQL